MIEKAIAKIKGEMNQHKDKPYIQYTGAFLLEQVEANPEAAEHILVEGKTISNAVEEVRKAAVKKKVGNCAIVSDQEGFNIVLKYFGIVAAVGTVSKSGVADVANTIEKNQTSGVSFEVNLEDLLV